MTGSLLLLHRMLPFAIDDRAFMEAMMWTEEEGSTEMVHGLKLAESLMKLLFKNKYTINLPGELDPATYEPDMTTVDQNLVWRKGVSTVGDVPQDRHYGNTHYEKT